VSQAPIEIQSFEQVPEPLRPAADAISAVSMHPMVGTGAQVDENRDRFCSQSDVSKYLLALHDGAVVGLTATYRRVVEMAGRRLVLGGIGDVHVQEELRRQGIATRLAQSAVCELDLVGCDVAYLCTDVRRPEMVRLYGRAGFVLLNRPLTYLGASGRRYVDHDAMIAPVRSRELFEAILSQSGPFDIGRGNW
jgi:GNAT superfamily N-acetyltransferase